VLKPNDSGPFTSGQLRSVEDPVESRPLAPLLLSPRTFLTGVAAFGGEQRERKTREQRRKALAEGDRQRWARKRGVSVQGNELKAET
jgi:hypothetical protein